MFQMKKMVAVIAIAATSIGGAQALTTGDIAFTGIASNDASVSQFSLVTFADLVAGTTIYITDTNYKQNGASSPFGFVGSTGSNGVIVSGTPESYIAWTVGSNLAAGTDVDFSFNSNSLAATSTAGSVSMANSTANTSGFSGTADSLWVYAPGSSYNTVGTMLTALTTYPSGSGDNLPGTITASGLTTGSTDTSLNGVNSVTAVKYAFYDGATSFDSVADAKAAIANTSNWSVSGTASTSALPTANLTITAAVPEPSSYAMLLAGLCMIGVVARRRSA